MTIVETSHRSCWSRCCGPLRPGSLRSGLIVLTVTAIGTGVLALPYVMLQLGWIAGTVLIMAMGALNCVSLEVLVDAGMHYGVDSYTDLLYAVAGESGANFVDLVVALDCWGTICTYWLFIGHIMPVLLEDVALASFGIPYGWCDQNTLLIVVAVFVLTVTLPKNITAMGDCSIIGIFSILYLSLLLIYTAFQGFPSNILNLPEVQSQTSAVSGVQNVTNAAALVMFSFLCQCNVFSVYYDIDRPTPRRLRKITRFSTLFQTASYVITAVCGYAAFGADTRSNIFLSFPQGDPWVTVGRLLVCCSLCIAIPLNVHPTRATLIGVAARRWSVDRASDDMEPDRPTRCIPECVPKCETDLAEAISRVNNVYESADAGLTRKASKTSRDRSDFESKMFDSPRMLHSPHSLTFPVFSVVSSGRGTPRSPRSRGNSDLAEHLLEAQGTGKIVGEIDLKFDAGGDTMAQLLEHSAGPDQTKGAIKDDLEAFGVWGWFVHVFITLLVVAVSLLLAFLFPSVNGVMGAVGGVFGAMQMWILPCCVLYHTTAIRTPSQRIIIMCGFATAGLVGFGSVAVSLL